jgi:hypothetical protein
MLELMEKNKEKKIELWKLQKKKLKVQSDLVNRLSWGSEIIFQIHGTGLTLLLLFYH